MKPAKSNCFQVFALVYSLLLCQCWCQDELSQIKKLRNDLLVKGNYDKLSRPVKNHDNTMSVEFILSIVQFDINMQKHTLTSETWFRMEWTDEYLAWDPNTYGGLKELHFGSDEIWKPDINIWNSAESLIFNENIAPIQLVVNATGFVAWAPPATFITTCPLDLSNYPFDEQKCNLMFGSWAHHAGQINLTTEGHAFFESGPWYTNPEWTYLRNSSKREEFNFPGYGTYPTLSLTVYFRRNATFYHYTVFLPSIAAMLMTLTIFWLPSHSSIRFTLGTLSLIILMLLLLYLGLQLGVSSIGVPLAIRNLSSLIMMVGVALVYTTLAHQLMLSCINSRFSVPPAVVNLLKGAGQFICITDPSGQITNKMGIEQTQLSAEDGLGADLTPPSNANLRHQEWAMAFQLLDRAMFLIYFVLMIAKHA